MNVKEKTIEDFSVQHVSEIKLEGVFTKINAGLTKTLLTERSKEMSLALAVVTNTDGSKKIALYCPEYGDGDGIDSIRSFVSDVSKLGLLKKGESLDLYVVKLNLDGLMRVANEIEMTDFVKGD